LSLDALTDVTQANRPYEPYGAALELMYARESEVLLSGPAGTGKSRACLEKMFTCAEKYPGMRGLIIRKTRESLTETGLVTWETKVVPSGHECLLNGGTRNHRQSYRFANGSEIIVGGIDKASKIMSTEYDMIFPQEATELAENDWESLSTRLRNGKMPYQQIIADCNPGPPKHWLKQRQIRVEGDGRTVGKTRHIESRHEDNPIIWDRKLGKPTERGEKYLAILDGLSGHRRDRLRWGRWTQAEGVVYDGWDDAVHLVDRFAIPYSWPRYWSIDFGYTNPFVWQHWAESPDGDLYLVQEIYHSKILVESHADRIETLTENQPRPRVIICDHDAEGRATLEKKLGITTTPANKVKSAGIQDVQTRLQMVQNGQGQSRPKMFVFRDSLDRRDRDLLAMAKPTSTAEEFAGYIWDESNGRRKGEEPVDKDNHGMDALRYMCRHLAHGPTGTVDDIRMGGGSILDDVPDGIFGMV
jgi:PBSX family phage terminase large subunit